MQKQIQRRSYQQEDSDCTTSVDPLLSRIYRARGVGTNNPLGRQLSELHDYRQLKGLQQAVQLLAHAVVHHQSIVIVGDFDCDGATSCALGVLALRAMAGQAHCLVPNRFTHGYGLTPAIVAVAQSYQPDLLMTVDNGITSIDGVQAAKAKGITVIITDHHLAGDALPAADAIVNPNQPGCAFPGKHTAGVGVIFYVMGALRATLRARGWFQQRPEPNLAAWLDLVALGTVADRVPLDTNNRILVFQGLKRIRAGHGRPGITALMAVAGRHPSQLTAADLGFALGPRLNAAGRLEDMSLGVELLLTDDSEHARALAAKLDTLNTERKAIEARMQQQALQTLAQQTADSEPPWGVCLFQPDWHQGVIGILAARIKETLHRPVIAFAEAELGYLKGSARAIPGLHLRNLLAYIAQQHPALIITFGGHAMAAGLTIKKAELQRFQAAFNAAVKQQLDPAALTAVVYTDGSLQPAEFSLATAQRLQEGGPWGQQFPEPSFDGLFHIVQQRLMGGKHLKLVLKIPATERCLEAVAFNIDSQQWPKMSVTQLKAVYQLSINEYRGQRRLQLLIDYLEPVDDPVLA